MIYLIITTCLLPRYGAPQVVADRATRYQYAIRHTLSQLPLSGAIQPVIVENNGQRSTFLDQFTWNHNGQQEKVPVIYTHHNAEVFRNKGVNELMDVQYVLHSLQVAPDDIVIKLTGRYRVTSPRFFETILQHPTDQLFLRFYNAHTQKDDPNDCVLGMYAIRAMHLYLFYPSALDLYDSAEVGFAMYARRCISQIHEMDELGLECQFADDAQGILRHV